MRNLDMESMPTREPVNKLAQVENKGDMFRGNWNKRRPKKSSAARMVGKRVHDRVAAEKSELDNILAEKHAEFVAAYAPEQAEA